MTEWPGAESRRDVHDQECIHGSPGERRSPRAYYLGLTDIRQAATLSDIEPPYVKLMSGPQLAACLEVPLKTEVPSHTQFTERAVKLTTPAPPPTFFSELLKNAQSQRAEIPAMVRYFTSNEDPMKF